jgi:hypothetical protein
MRRKHSDLGICSIAAFVIGVTGLTEAAAAPLSVDEEFAVAQQFHADLAVNLIYAGLIENGIRPGASSWMYQGNFDYAVLNGDVTGAYQGTLSGFLMGESWVSSLSATATSNSPPTFNLSSTGTWKRGPYAGKSYTDSGTVVVKDNGKADVDLAVKTVTKEGEGGEEDETVTNSASATDLDVEEKDDKTTVSGEIEVEAEGKSRKLDAKIILDKKDKTFTSSITYGWFTVTDNKGTFTVAQLTGSTFRGTTDFSIEVTPVPLPPSLLLLIGGVLTFAIPRQFRDRGIAVRSLNGAA